jgi:hypothetical protein
MTMHHRHVFASRAVDCALQVQFRASPPANVSREPRQILGDVLRWVCSRYSTFDFGTAFSGSAGPELQLGSLQERRQPGGQA